MGTDLCTNQVHPLIKKSIYDVGPDQFFICPIAEKYSKIKVNFKDDLKTHMKVRPCTKKDNPNCIEDTDNLQQYLDSIFIQVGATQQFVDLTSKKYMEEGNPPLRFERRTS